MILVLAILVIGAFAVYVLTPEERRRLLGLAVARGGRFGRWLIDCQDDRKTFLTALRTRTRWPVATFAIVGINIALFVMLLSASAGLDEADRLLRAGASFGPRTGNSEWWRLVTAVFVHRGWVSLLFDVAVIMAIGRLLERLLGPIAFALVFVSGGVLANCVHLAGHPLAIRTGAWGAIYALLGPLTVWCVRSLRHQSELSIPRSLFRQLGPVVALFLLASIAADPEALAADLAALTFGLAAGAVLMAGIAEATPGARRLGAIAGVAIAIALVLALPSRGIADVRPEIARVLALEGRTAGPYDKAVGQFKLGATSAETLARMIDRQILPQVRQAGVQLAALRGVPVEHQPLIADAKQYVRLRDESWELRARALHTANMRALRLADDRERASLDALARLKAADPSRTGEGTPR